MQKLPVSEPEAVEANETGVEPHQGGGQWEPEGASATSGSGAEGQGGGYVLDASALLCLMNDEPGAARVAAVLPQAVISTMNLAEVATKLNDLGADAQDARALLAPLHLAVVPLDEGTAFAAGALRVATRALGLSLGDRVCLALAAQRGAIALTTDKAWQDAGPLARIKVELLR